MANPAFTFGLMPVLSASGLLRQNEYILKTGATVYRGDVVMMDATGTVTPITNGSSSVCFGVALAYATDAAGAGGVKVSICDDLSQVFVINCKSTSSGTEIAATDIFANFPIYLGAGSATTYLSGYYLDIDNINASTTTLPLRALGIFDSPDNAYGKNCKVLVKFNQQASYVGTAGV